MLKFLTAGESHGKGCIVIIDGMPSNVPISLEQIQTEMQKRRHDFGRGGRGIIEDDKIDILSGIYHGKTIGSPITIYIENKDFKNWKNKTEDDTKVTNPRPGHTDLSGYLKYGFNNIRPVIERSSARETTARVAAGAIFKQFLAHFGIQIASHTLQIGSVKLAKTDYTFEEVSHVFENNPDIRCIDAQTSEAMKEAINQARINKDTLGGVVEIWAVNVPVGLGSYVQYDQKIDGQIAQALMSIPSVKTVEIGDCINNIEKTGSKFHDEIFYDPNKGYLRKTNHAGGIEGGVTNGMPIILRVYHKPISTLYNPLKTMNIETKKESTATVERSDICIVPRGGVVAESMLSFVLTQNFLTKFGSDNMDDIQQAYENYLNRLKS